MVYMENYDSIHKVKDNRNCNIITDIYDEETKSKEFETYIRDELVNIETGQKTIVHEGECNLIVEGFGRIVAGLLKGEPGHSGLTHWAIGQGDFPTDPQTSPWDVLSVGDRQALAVPTLTQLFSESARSPVGIDFLDALDNVTTSITNRLEIRAAFDQTISGFFREFGIFGGDATPTLNSGIMMDIKLHSVVSMNIGSPTSVRNITLRLTI